MNHEPRRFQMGRRFLASVGSLVMALAGLWLTQITAAGQTPRATAATPSAAATWTPSRTPWGDPDLQGLWTSNGMGGVPLERSDAFGDRKFLTNEEFAKRLEDSKKMAESYDADHAGSTGAGPSHWLESWGWASRQTSLIVDPPNGKMPPFTAEGARMTTVGGTMGRGPFNGPEDFNTWDRCITRGLPSAMIPTAYNNAYRILQIPGYVTILYEMIHLVRVIPLDGRPHLDKTISLWDGDSRGRWDGTTLVVDVTNFSEQTKGALPANGSSMAGSSGRPYVGTGESLHLVERFTRTDAGTINYAATVDDGRMYTRPWTIALDLKKDDPYMIFEYACHEGNHAIENSLKGARAQEKATEADAKNK
jgi:hypothetical protein